MVFRLPQFPTYQQIRGTHLIAPDRLAHQLASQIGLGPMASACTAGAYPRGFALVRTPLGRAAQESFHLGGLRTLAEARERLTLDVAGQPEASHAGHVKR
jgi:hypothetical protein